MEDTNNQDDNIDIDSNNGTIDESSDSEEEDSENEDKPPIWLNNKISLQRLKQNDSEITNLSISLRDNYFNNIDWKEEKNGNCISDNTQLKEVLIFSPTTLSQYILGNEGQDLPTRQQLQDFFSCIYRNSSITSLSISSIRIVDEFGRSLIEGLGDHPSLTRFDWHCRIQSVVCIALRNVLNNTKSKLKDLRLCYCNLDDEGLGILCDGLLGSSTMKKLNLNGNTYITSVGWRVLSTAIRHQNCKLNEFGLYNTGLDDEGSGILGSALSGLLSLKTLNLGCNKSISTAGWQTLFNRLSQTSLVNLDLNTNNIRDASLASLANIGTLKTLDLLSNKSITPSGWQYLFYTLQTREAQLVKLNISYNRIGNEGIAALGRLLGSMSTLKTLRVSNMSNNVTS